MWDALPCPDIDTETMALVPDTGLSSPAEARQPRTSIALLHGRVEASLAATTPSGADQAALERGGNVSALQEANTRPDGAW